MEPHRSNSPTDSHDSFFDDVVIIFPKVPVISTARFPIEPGSSCANVAPQPELLQGSVVTTNEPPEQNLTEKTSADHKKDKLVKLMKSIIKQELAECSHEVEADTVNHLGSQDGSDLTQPPVAVRIKEELTQHLSLEVSSDTQNNLGSQDSNHTQPPPAKRIKQEIVECSQEVQVDSLNHLGSEDSCGPTQPPRRVTVKQEPDHPLVEVVEDEPTSSRQNRITGVEDDIPLRYDQEMNLHYPGVESGFQCSSIAVHRGSPVPSLDSLSSHQQTQLPDEVKENQKSNKNSNQSSTQSKQIILRRTPFSSSSDSTVAKTEQTDKPSSKPTVTIKQENNERFSQKRRQVSDMNEVVDATDSDCSLEALCGSQLSQDTTDRALPPGSQKSRPSLFRHSSMEVQWDELSQRPCSCGAICICLLRTEART